MMAIPLKYNLRSLRVRWRSTITTVLGIAFTVAVFVLVMALASGLRAIYMSTGDPRNLLVIRKGALAESSSQITFDEVRRTKYLDGVARDANGEPLASAEMVILITMERNSGGRAHVQVRGLGPMGEQLRPRLNLVAGRMFRPGLRECIVSQSVARRFEGCALGESFKSGKIAWKVVGVFEARKTAYDSEIWVDVDEARDAFNRTFYCSIILRPVDESAAAALAQRLESDRQMRLRALTETEYYREQTKTAEPIRLFGACLAIIMGIGAAFSTMNTMYASVGARAREIGTMRVLGFRRRNIYLAFLIEAVLLALVGAALGCALSLPLHGLATGTFNWKTFAEVAFEFRITGPLLGLGMVFGVVMGVVGGLLPSRLAAHKPILEALRAD
jgi:putative ABC transport system permease protein